VKTNNGANKEEVLEIPEGYKLYKKVHNVQNVETDDKNKEDINKEEDSNRKENLKNDNTTVRENTQKNDTELTKNDIPHMGLSNLGLIGVMGIIAIFAEVYLIKYTDIDRKK